MNPDWTLPPDNFDILLCGNPGMVDTVIDWAEARGLHPG